jgi:hypothetical protein
LHAIEFKRYGLLSFNLETTAQQFAFQHHFIDGLQQPWSKPDVYLECRVYDASRDLVDFSCHVSTPLFLFLSAAPRLRVSPEKLHYLTYLASAGRSMK